MAFLYLNFTDKAGFGNNFTTVDNKSTAQSVEGIIVSAMFKSLITRCASTTHELHSPENLVSTWYHVNKVTFSWVSPVRLYSE